VCPVARRGHRRRRRAPRGRALRVRPPVSHRATTITITTTTTLAAAAPPHERPRARRRGQPLQRLRARRLQQCRPLPGRRPRRLRQRPQGPLRRPPVAQQKPDHLFRLPSFEARHSALAPCMARDRVRTRLRTGSRWRPPHAWLESILRLWLRSWSWRAPALARCHRLVPWG
jgi:hypothetical protein